MSSVEQERSEVRHEEEPKQNGTNVAQTDTRRNAGSLLVSLFSLLRFPLVHFQSDISTVRIFQRRA